MPDPLITLLTDFGTEDAYVAQMKGQILSICPRARIVDVSHAIPPQDILSGAMILAQSAPYFPADTLHVVVVDPGVGTDRPLVAVEIETQTETDEPHRLQRFVLPDNGLIDLLVEQFVVLFATRLTERQYWRLRPSNTFHGRDILGPVAAHWALGCSREQFGPAYSLQPRLQWPMPESSNGWIVGEILFVDHFGNAVTNLPANCLHSTRALPLVLYVDNCPLQTMLAQTYGQYEDGDTIVLVGSHGFLEIAIVGGSAAQKHELKRGNLVRMAVESERAP